MKKEPALSTWIEISKTAFKTFDQIVQPVNTADKFCNKLDGGRLGIRLNLSLFILKL